MSLRLKLRLIVWSLAVVGAAVGHRQVMGYAGLAVIFALLCTTPANAIRLPRLVSDVTILSCSLILQTTAQHYDPWTHSFIVILMLLILRLWRQSPWWAVLYAWC